MAWKTGDFVLDILHSVEDHLEDLPHEEAKLDEIDAIIHYLNRLKKDVSNSRSSND